MEPEPTMKNLNDAEIVTERLDEACDMDTDGVVKSAALIPIAPHSSTERTDLPLVLSSLQTEPPKTSCFESGKLNHGLNSLRGDVPHTPRDAISVPFASAPDRLLGAPFCKKYRTSTCILSSPLKYKDTEQGENDAEKISENRMVEAVYEDLLDAIIAKRGEELSRSDDGCKTPTLENLLKDVAETCPDAPARTENLKNTSKVSSKKKLHFHTTGLCRKLEF